MCLRRLTVFVFLLSLTLRTFISCSQTVQDTVFTHTFKFVEPYLDEHQLMVFWFTTVAEAKLLREGVGIYFFKKTAIVRGGELKLNSHQAMSYYNIKAEGYDKFKKIFIEDIEHESILVSQTLPGVTCSVLNYPDKFIRNDDLGCYKSFQLNYNDKIVFYEFRRTTTYLRFLKKCLVILRDTEPREASIDAIATAIQKQITAIETK